MNFICVSALIIGYVLLSSSANARIRGVKELSRFDLTGKAGRFRSTTAELAGLGGEALLSLPFSSRDQLYRDSVVLGEATSGQSFLVARTAISSESIVQQIRLNASYSATRDQINRLHAAFADSRRDPGNTSAVTRLLDVLGEGLSVTISEPRLNSELVSKSRYAIHQWDDSTLYLLMVNAVDEPALVDGRLDEVVDSFHDFVRKEGHSGARAADQYNFVAQHANAGGMYLALATVYEKDDKITASYLLNGFVADDKIFRSNINAVRVDGDKAVTDSYTTIIRDKHNAFAQEVFDLGSSEGLLLLTGVHDFEASETMRKVSSIEISQEEDEIGLLVDRLRYYLGDPPGEKINQFEVIQEITDINEKPVGAYYLELKRIRDFAKHNHTMLLYQNK